VLNLSLPSMADIVRDPSDEECVFVDGPVEESEEPCRDAKKSFVGSLEEDALEDEDVDGVATGVGAHVGGMNGSGKLMS